MSQILELDAKTFQPAEYNPEDRTEAKAIKDLMGSIWQHGQFIPIIATKNDGRYTIVDGHRRVAACIALGKKVKTIVLSDSTVAATAYAEINRCSKKLRAKDRLYVYLIEPDAVDKSTRDYLSTWSRTIIKFVRDKRGSIATLRQAQQVAKYCDVDAEAAVRWLLNQNMTYRTRKAIEAGIDAYTLRSAIEHGRPIRNKWEAA